MHAAVASTFTVTNTAATSYNIGGTANAAIVLRRGSVYAFTVTATGHPFWIKTAAVTGTASAFSSGIINNGLQSGTLYFTVPDNAPDTLYYICQYHGVMTGVIRIFDGLLCTALLDSFAELATLLLCLQPLLL